MEGQCPPAPERYQTLLRGSSRSCSAFARPRRTSESVRIPGLRNAMPRSEWRRTQVPLVEGKGFCETAADFLPLVGGTRLAHSRSVDWWCRSFFARRRTRSLGRVAQAMSWFSVLGLGACSRAEPNRESTAVSRLADTMGPCTFSAPPTGGTPTNVTFTVKTPNGVAPADFALASDLGSLRVESGVKLIKDAGGFASVGSMEATARLFLGAGVEGQSAFSELIGIDAGNNVRLRGVVKTANPLTRGAN